MDTETVTFKIGFQRNQRVHIKRFSDRLKYALMLLTESDPVITTEWTSETYDVGALEAIRDKILEAREARIKPTKIEQAMMDCAPNLNAEEQWK